MAARSRLIGKRVRFFTGRYEDGLELTVTSILNEPTGSKFYVGLLVTGEEHGIDIDTILEWTILPAKPTLISNNK